jgi:hypothetical protein
MKRHHGWMSPTWVRNASSLRSCRGGCWLFDHPGSCYDGATGTPQVWPILDSWIQLFCLFVHASWYNKQASGARAWYLQYDHYLLTEALPLRRHLNDNRS